MHPKLRYRYFDMHRENDVDYLLKGHNINTLAKDATVALQTSEYYSFLTNTDIRSWEVYQETSFWIRKSQRFSFLQPGTKRDY